MQRLQSELASRHIALGSNLEPWIGVGTAWSYTVDARDEHDAVRESSSGEDHPGYRGQQQKGHDPRLRQRYVISKDSRHTRESGLGAV